jgi:hypothetical protein
MRHYAAMEFLSGVAAASLNKHPQLKGRRHRCDARQASYRA